MAGPPRRLLSREQIVAAAGQLIDTHGLNEFSTRKLAAALGVRGPSLYNYFATKDEVLHAVANQILEHVDLSMFGRDHWVDALRLWACSFRSAMLEHPNIVPILAPEGHRRPAVLAMADAVLDALIDAGWPTSRAVKIGALMHYYITGSALGSFAHGYPTNPDLYDRYPHLGRDHQLVEHRWETVEGAFELGLSALLEGLVWEYDRTVGGRQS